jgi:phage-related minor tail protein
MVPTLEGVEGHITQAFAPAEREAADSGKKSGAAWSSSLKGAIGVAAVGAAVVAGFKGLYEVGAVFDDVTDTIRTGTGLQGEALDGLVDVAKQVGNQVPAQFDQIGTTVADLNTRLGLSGDTLTTVASQYLEAGRILGEEVDVKKTSAAFSAFRIEGDEVAGAMDTLFQVSQATGVGMNDLASGVQRTAPALQALGFGFEDSVALLGSLDKAGLNSQQMMGALSKGLVTLAKDGEEPQAAFQRVTGELQGFIDEGDKAGALNLASKIFGTRGASQFVGAIESGVLSMDDLMAATGATGDTILGVGAETADAAEQWQVLKNKALTALEPIGTALFTALGDGLGFINQLLDGADFSMFGELLGYLSPLGIIFKALQPLLPEIMATLGPALQQVMAAMLPVLQTVVGTFSELLASVLPPLLPIITMLADLIGQVLLAVTPLLPPLIQLVSAIFPILASVVSALMPVFQGVVNMLSTILIPVVEMLVDVLGGVVEFLTGVFTGDWEKAWNGILSIFEGIWNGLGDVFIGVLNGVIDLINGFLGGLNEVGNWVSDMTGGAIDINFGQIPHLAEGATILPRRGGTLAVLAEAGRAETVVDTGLLNRALEEGLDGAGRGGNVQVDVHPAAGMDEVTIGKIAASEIDWEMRRG